MPSMSEARRMIASVDTARTNRREMKRKLDALLPERRDEIIRQILVRDDIFAPAVAQNADAAMNRIYKAAARAEDGYAAAYERFWDTRAIVIRGFFKGKIADLFIEDAPRRIAETRNDIRGWDGRILQEIHDLYLDLLSDGMLARTPIHSLLAGLDCMDALGQFDASAVDAVSGGDGFVVRNEDGDMLQVSDYRLRICRMRDIEGSAADIAALNSLVIGEQRRMLDEVLEDIESHVEQNGGAARWHGSELLAIEAFRPDWHLRRTMLATRLANELFLRTGRRCGALADGFRFKPGEERYGVPDLSLADEGIL